MKKFEGKYSKSRWCDLSVGFYDEETRDQFYKHLMRFVFPDELYELLDKNCDETDPVKREEFLINREYHFAQLVYEWIYPAVYVAMEWQTAKIMEYWRDVNLGGYKAGLPKNAIKDMINANRKIIEEYESRAILGKSAFEH